MPGSIIIDEPVTYGGWSPKNWDEANTHEYHSAAGVSGIP